MSIIIWYDDRHRMPQSATRKARTRAEIFDHAARLFRLRGYGGTNIDDIMLAAGLTRGAFYAHFTSKDDLFAETIRAGHGLLARARADGAVPAIDAYLDFLFTEWGVKTLISKTQVRNVRALGAMRKVGAKVREEAERNGKLEYIWTLEPSDRRPPRA